MTLVTDGNHFEGEPDDRSLLLSRGIAVLEDDALALEGSRGALESVRLRGGRSLPCQLSFFSSAHSPNNDLATEAGCMIGDDGCIAVDRDGVTSAPGVDAAGDLTPAVQLIANAVAKGTAAALRCAHSLLGERA